MSNTGNGITRITAAGSAVISDKPVTVRNIIVGAAYVGTVELYNFPSTGTVAANLVYTVGTFPATDQHKVLPLNLSFSKGLSYYATGTPTVIVSTE
jgi:hypothetical protein